MMSIQHLNNTHFEVAMDALATHGYAILPQFISLETMRPLAQRATELQQLGLLKPASTGKNARLDAALRGDTTYWLSDATSHPAERDYLATMNSLQFALNRNLYLGLHTLESHFAIYPTGAFYAKHLDQFNRDQLNSNQARQGDVRQLSCILYLNEAWQADDGGQLRIYLDGADASNALEVLPEGGTLVLFMSSRFYHEVLPANRPRMSLTGWFKTRSNVAF